MTGYPKPFDDIVPQAGAILHLDTELDYDRKDVKLGNKHWVLDGSCVLVAPDRVLTVRHALDKTRQAAVFFPFHGISWLAEPRVEDYEYGDTLCLCRLDEGEEELTHVPPVPYKFISRKTLGSALVTGYGRWSNKDDWEEDGIQRSLEVKLHLPGSRGSTRYGDNLDINWWSGWNQELGAGRNHSGGPMLRLDDRSRTLLGLTREATKGQQAGSRITRDREQWLIENLGTEPFIANDVPRMCYRRLMVSTNGVYERFGVPESASHIRVTLSATPGLRLQMGFDVTGERQPFLEALKGDDLRSGRFLRRSHDLPQGTGTIWIGVVPVSRAPVGASQVQAQLCCMFT